MKNGYVTLRQAKEFCNMHKGLLVNEGTQFRMNGMSYKVLSNDYDYHTCTMNTVDILSYLKDIEVEHSQVFCESYVDSAFTPIIKVYGVNEINGVRKDIFYTILRGKAIIDNKVKVVR